MRGRKVVRRLTGSRALACLFLIVILAAIHYAEAASIAYTESGAGEGSNTITPYGVNNVAYALDPFDPQLLRTVSFSLQPPPGAAAASEVRAKVLASSSTYTACTYLGGTSWECLLNVTVNPADLELSVIAAQ